MSDTHSGLDASDFQEEGAPAGQSDVARSPDRSDSDESGMEALLRDNEFSLRSLRRGETVEGTVVRVDEDEVLVDVGMKSEGVIPSRELYSDSEDLAPLGVGDRVLVYVMHPEGSEGHAILSLRRARMERSWREIEEFYQRGGIIEAPVVDFNKGGLIVDVRGVRGFVPVSQVLDLRNVARQDGENEEVSQTLATMQGRRLPLKIIEINRSRNRLILSERAAAQEQRTLRKDELMDQLQPGQIRRGIVSNLTTFGAFVDLGGADGLVHVSELSYNRVNHPNEILRVGQEVDVMVLSVAGDTKKIALSLKRAMPDPWTTVEQQYRVGEVVPAVITKLAKFGAFAKVQEGLEGLIHLTELTDLPVHDAAQVVREGQYVNVKIIHINSQRRRLGLSVRQAGEQLGGMQSFGEHEPHSPFAATAAIDPAGEMVAPPEPAAAEVPGPDTMPVEDRYEVDAAEPAIASEESTLAVDEPAVASEEPAVTYEEPATVHLEAPAALEEPVAASKEPTTLSEEPIVTLDEPAVASEEPPAILQEPAAVAETIDEPVPQSAAEAAEQADGTATQPEAEIEAVIESPIPSDPVPAPVSEDAQPQEEVDSTDEDAVPHAEVTAEGSPGTAVQAGYDTPESPLPGDDEVQTEVTPVSHQSTV